MHVASFLSIYIVPFCTNLICTQLPDIQLPIKFCMTLQNGLVVLTGYFNSELHLSSSLTSIMAVNMPGRFIFESVAFSAGPSGFSCASLYHHP